MTQSLIQIQICFKNRRNFPVWTEAASPRIMSVTESSTAVEGRTKGMGVGALLHSLQRRRASDCKVELGGYGANWLNRQVGITVYRHFKVFVQD